MKKGKPAVEEVEEVEELSLEDGKEADDDVEEGEDDAAKNSLDRGDVVEDGEGEEGDPDTAKVGKADKDGLEAVASEDDDENEQVTIPKGRLNRSLTRTKNAEGEVERLRDENERLRSGKQAEDEATAAKKVAFDYDVKEEAYATQLMEGNTKKAAEIRREINNALKAEAKDEAVAESELRSNSQRAADRLTESAEEMIDKYPFLDDKNKAVANKEAIAEVIEWRDFYMSKGNPPHVALRKAADKIGPQYAKADEVEEEEEQTPAQRRNVTSIMRGVKVAQQQPQRLSATGTGERARAGKVNVAEMTEDEFEKMSPAEKKRLRGDEG